MRLDFAGDVGDVEVVVDGVVQVRHLATTRVPARHDVEITFADEPWVEVDGDAAALRFVWTPDDPALAPSVRYEVARRVPRACVPCSAGCTAGAPGVLSVDALFADGTEARVANTSRAQVPACGPEPVRPRIAAGLLAKVHVKVGEPEREAAKGQDYTFFARFVAATSAFIASLIVRCTRRRTLVG
jgi:hypothetical protein